MFILAFLCGFSPLLVTPPLPTSLQPQSSQVLSQVRVEHLAGDTGIWIRIHSPKSAIHSFPAKAQGQSQVENEVVFLLISISRCVVHSGGLMMFLSQLRWLVFSGTRAQSQISYDLTSPGTSASSLQALSVCAVLFPSQWLAENLSQFQQFSSEQRCCHSQEVRARWGFQGCVGWHGRNEGQNDHWEKGFLW